MARAALDWSIDDLAAASGVGRATVQRFEATGQVKDSTAGLIRTAFEQVGVQFIGAGPHAGGVAPPHTAGTGR